MQESLEWIMTNSKDRTHENNSHHKWSRETTYLYMLSLSLRLICLEIQAIDLNVN